MTTDAEFDAQHKVVNGGFDDWYTRHVAAKLYADQAAYERESVTFSSVDRLTREEVLALFASMTTPQLKLALFDHVCAAVTERWDPGAPPDFADDP